MALTPLLAGPPSSSHAFATDGVLLFAPRAIRNRRHAHFAATWVIAVNRPFSLTLDGVGRRAYTSVLLGPNVPRRLDSHGEPLIDLLIDPDDAAYRYLAPHLAHQPVAVPERDALRDVLPSARRCFAGEMDGAQAGDWVRALLETLTPTPPAALPWDGRIVRAAAFMRASLTDGAPTLRAVADHVDLSESRLRHLFREQLGLPVRQYLLWLRLRRAMVLWSSGAAPADLAVGAGFYDQAHFTRTLRRMTDYAPSGLTGGEFAVAPLRMPDA